MALTKTNNAEGGTSGSAVSTANSGGTSGTAWNLLSSPSGNITYDTASAIHGSLGYALAPASGSQAVLRWTGFNDLTGVVRFYLTVDSLPAANESIFAAYTTGSALVLSVGMRSDGTYIISDSTTLTVGTHTTNAYQAGDRIELSWTVGASTTTGSFNFAFYRGDNTTAVETKSGSTQNFGTTNWDYAQFGKNGTSTWTSQLHFDDFAGASGTTTFFGPTTGVAPPAADAGPDQAAIEPWATVTLDGSGSTAVSPATITTYAWTQTAGTAVSLSSAVAVQPTFTAPAAITGSTLTFSLIVTDSNGASSAPDTVNVIVLGVAERAVVGGVEVPLHVQSLTGGTLG